VSSSVNIRTISERVFLHIDATDDRVALELRVGEAMSIRDGLTRAIERIGSGDSVAPNFPAFLQSIPGRKTA
jgi:hypothetical protein